MLVLQALKTTVAYLVEMAVLVAVLIIKLGRLVEERRRSVSLAPRWPTAAAAVCLLLGLLFGLAGKFPGLSGAAFDKYLLQWIQNALIMGSYFSLQLLFLPPVSSRPGPVRRESLLFAVVLLVLLVLTGVMWAHGYSNDDSPRSLGSEPAVATFYLLGSVYLVYIAGTVAVRAAGYVLGTGGWTRAGLALTALGAGMQSAGSALRLYPKLEAALTGSYSEFVYSLSSPLANLSKPIIVVGLVLPLLAGRLAALGRMNDRRRHHRRMYTLWSVTLTVFPEVQRRPVPVEDEDSPAGSGAPASSGGFTFRYVRRITECRDGIARAGSAVAGASLDGDGDGRRALVTRFWEELAACGLNAPQLTGADLDEEARQLADASMEMSRRGVGWAADPQ